MIDRPNNQTPDERDPANPREPDPSGRPARWRQAMIVAGEVAGLVGGVLAVIEWVIALFG